MIQSILKENSLVMLRYDTAVIRQREEEEKKKEKKKNNNKKKQQQQKKGKDHVSRRK